MRTRLRPSLSGAVHRLYRRLRDKTFSTAMAPGFHSFGPHSIVQPPLRLYGEKAIDIGAGVFIGSGAWLEAVDVGYRGTPMISIGEGTSIAGSCVISAADRVVLGRRVLFAKNVYVADHRHAFADTTLAVLDQGIEDVRPVKIEDGAWLGQGVVVTPGVTIGAGAVIGANSVVTTDIPAHTLAVGAPARVVRAFGSSS